MKALQTRLRGELAKLKWPWRENNCHFVQWGAEKSANERTDAIKFLLLKRSLKQDCDKCNAEELQRQQSALSFLLREGDTELEKDK